MKKISKENKRIITNIFSSAITAGVLVMALFAIQAFQDKNDYLLTLFYGFAFIFLSLSRLPIAVNAIKNDPNKVVMIKYFAFSLIYLVCGIVIFANYGNLLVCGVASGIYLLTIGANRICRCIEKPKPFHIVVNTILATACTVFAIIIFVAIDLFVLYVVIALIVIMFIAIAETLIFAFSQMKLKGLMKIIRKTYAFEVLYGLVVLILSFSVYFMIMEEKIVTYEDALWYSFAIVTTIGFGDFSVVEPISRLLSVLLGIYGIITVAVLTSVIVNYYTEVSTKEQMEKAKKKLEEKPHDEEEQVVDKQEPEESEEDQEE